MVIAIETIREQKRARVYLTKVEVTSDKAEKAANANGRFMGTVKVVFDQQFIKSLGSAEFFVHPKDAPTRGGWYQVDGENHRFRKISDSESRELKMHEKLYVYSTVFQAIKKGDPLVLQICYGDFEGGEGLALHGKYYAAGCALRVAQVGAGHEAAAVPKALTARLRREGVRSTIRGGRAAS